MVVRTARRRDRRHRLRRPAGAALGARGRARPQLGHGRARRRPGEGLGLHAHAARALRGPRTRACAGSSASRRAAAVSCVLADLESEREFATNRTGLVVLHPPQLAGEALRVTHADGADRGVVASRARSARTSRCSTSRELSWLHDGLGGVGRASTGDVFEMEDQRNWSDASYKTYSRPLAHPVPVHDRRRRAGASERADRRARGRGIRLDALTPTSMRLAWAARCSNSALGRGDRARSRSRRRAGRGRTRCSSSSTCARRTGALRSTRAAASGAPLDVRVIAPAGAPFDALAAALAAAAATARHRPHRRVRGRAARDGCRRPGRAARAL